MRGKVAGEELYIVRLYDGFDREWMDVSKPGTYEEAREVWLQETDGGSENAEYDGIATYYDIFPANTRMIFSDGFSDPPR